VFRSLDAHLLRGHHDGFPRATMDASRLNPGFGCWELAFHVTLIKIDFDSPICLRSLSCLL